jgi:hypothetical protein
MSSYGFGFDDSLDFEVGYDSDDVEQEPSGQLSIGVDGEQRAIPGLAPEGKPAPLNFILDEMEKAARDELEQFYGRVNYDDPMAGRVNYDPQRGA